MTHTYNISGMTCNSCVTKAKSELLKLGDVLSADVQLAAPQATITMQQHIPVAAFQNALSKAGNYTIEEADGGMHPSTVPASWAATYKPILLIVGYLAGITLSIEAVNGRFALDSWMQNFMAGFFLTFSFFKLLDLKGFAENYASYDIIARRWQGWGYVYALIELGLGLSFLLRVAPLATNLIAFVVMGVSITGVLQSVLNKQKIHCACLGAVFNLPMSTVTIIEDAAMIAMSGAMIVMML